MPATEYLIQNKARLAALHGLQVLDSGQEKVYDDVTQLTADLCGTPICLISLVDEDRQWFKSQVGLDVPETKIEQSICAHAVTQNDYLEIYDTQGDPRTLDNSLCQGDRAIRFYAGAILRSFDGWPVGTLCVLDFQPRELTDLQRRTLNIHANCVVRQLEFTSTLKNLLGSETSTPASATQAQNDMQTHEEIKTRFDTLTPREKQVVELIAGHSPSLTSKEIASQLGISFRTVHHHRANLMHKLDVDSVAEVISVILRAGIFK